jgi:hypothetical protein
MGRGFYEPVDDLGEMAAEPVLRGVHDALAAHFIASGHDHKALIRLIAGTRAYQQPAASPAGEPQSPAASTTMKMTKLRGDEVYDSLATAIALPNIQPEKPKPTDAIRFPIPPKSTRDLVNAAFGYDPSFQDSLLLRSMTQAMFMMNNSQIQKQIDARPESGTVLAEILAAEPDDRAAVAKLYRAVLARSPSDQEVQIVLGHLQKVNARGPAFEDLLWSLLNSAEFTTRR